MIDGSLFNLATKLQEVEKVRRVRLVEATTMDAISFIPAHMGAVRTKVKDLAKRKWKWGLEILEDDNGNKDIRIEDALRIIVPKEHWVSFQEMFVGELSNESYLNLQDLLNEAMEDELKDLRADFKPALLEMYNGQHFASLDKTIKVWQGRFGINRIVTNRGKVIVTSEHKGRDIQQLYSKLLRIYKEDRGGLEMLIADMENSRPLGAYDVFKKYNYLYGTHALSEHCDVTLHFVANIDMTFMTSESIYVVDGNAEEVLDEVEDLDSVKRVSNVLYPTNERFDVNFFDTLYNIIEEVTEEGEVVEEE